MDKAKQKLLEQTHQTILKVGFDDNDYELVADLISTNFVGFGTALDEKIFGIKDLKALLKRQKEQSKGIDMNVALRTLHTHFSENENTAVYIDEGVLSITTGEDSIEMTLRLSMVLEYIENKWLMVHFHSSKPEEVESEKDTWGIETWKEKAEALEKEVAERTADLVLKNRDLAIEAALERVRARSMAMHSSDELNQVVAVLFENLKELQIPVTAAGIQVYLEDSEDMLNYVCGENSEGLVISHYRMPYFDNAIINDFKNARDSEKGFFVGNYSKKIKDSFYNYLFDNTQIKDVPEDIKQMIFDSRAYTISMAPVSNSLIAINDFQGNQLSEYHVAIIKRFAKMFEQAYIRFRDLQKAEAQSKESQIQLALERVRAKTMAMQHSDELRVVVLEMYKQLKQLDFDSQACNIIIIDQNTDQQEYWVSGFSQELYPESYHIPNLKHPYIQQQIKAWKKGKTYEVFEYEGIEKKKFDKIFFSKTDFKKSPKEAQEMMRSLESITLSTAFTKYGSLQVLGPAPLNEEKASILLRFAKIFDQTYTRFLDLKKAEEQARDAKIEAALEKVRSRSMAMHHSVELWEVAELLFEQIKSLDIDTWSCGVSLWYDDDSYFMGYNPGPDGKLGTPMRLPLTEDIFFTTIRESKRRGDDFLVFESEGKSLAKTYHYMDKLPVVGEVMRGIVDAGFDLPKFQVTHCGFFSHGHMMFITLEHNPEAIDIFKRFTKVFDQTYTRFLDLQKAEAQAREAQIQLSLERVRAKSMAMQSSDELHDVIGIVFQQFDNLKIQPVNVFLSLFDREKRMLTYRASGKSGNRMPTKQTVDIDSVDAWSDLYNKWINDSSDDIEVIYYPKEIVPDILNLLKDTFLAMPKKDRMTLKDFPEGGYSTLGYTPFGYIGYDHTRPPTEEEKNILKRICTEFGRVYQRFLDLKKAEAQAREAQIEAALEKVRSRSMAMHNSQELKEVALELRKQMGLLGQKDLEVCAIHLYGNDEDSFESWSAMKASGSETEIVQTQAHFPKRGIRIVDEMVHHYTIGTKDYILVNEGEKIAEWFKVLKKHAPELHSSILDSIGKVPVKQLKANWAVADFSGGALVMVIYGEPDEVSRNLLRRSANAFEQAYVRFLDLQKAEAQAREAQIEAALERVRNKALAMHSSEDISLIVNTFFNELKKLNISMRRCGVGMVDLETKVVDVHVTIETHTQDSKMMTGKLTLSGHYVLDKIFETFKTKEEYHPVLSGKDLTDYYRAMNSGVEYPEFSFDETQYGYYFHFKEGGVFTWSDKELPEEDLQIFRKYTSVLSLTYRRYLDLKESEAQTREAQIEAALEKVRSRSLGMQHSNEMQQVANEVHQQLRNLGVDIDAMAMSGVIDNESDYDVWVGGEDYDKPLRIPYNNDTKVQRDYNKAIKERPEHFTKTYKGKTKDAYFEHLMATNAFNPKLKKMMLECSAFTTTLTFMKNSGMQIIRYNDKAFSDKDNSIVKRFGKVFEQAYIRFLDLEKAEAQTREAQIEAALEKVRSRSIGMQKSIELLEVISVVSQQLQTLGFRFSHVSFINNSLKEHNSFWVAATGLPNPMRFIIPYKAMPMIDNLRKAQKNKDAFYTNVSTIKEHQEWFKHLLKHSGENVFPKEIIDYQMSKGLARSISIHTNIMLALANTQSEPYSDYENKIIARFGQVFEQSYTRFLDLQRAEAQVKEAQIEAALERVRSRSMGMQKSEELEEIIQVVFDQFIQLGITVDHSGFIMDYKSRDDMHIWLADQHKITSQITLPYFDSPHWNSYNEAKKKGDNLFLNHLNFKEKNKFYKQIFKYVPDLPEDAKTFYLECPSLTIATTLADNIGLYIENYSGIQYSEEDQKILIRFGRVFQQTYTRFLDLQKAEAQAREAQIEAALEKVRSRSMAMQKSDELVDTADLMFQQVQALGVTSWNCGFNIWEEDKKYAMSWNGTKGGVSLPFRTNSSEDVFLNFYEASKRNESLYVEELDKKACANHYKYMATIPKLGEYFKEMEAAGVTLPEYQIFHIAYFQQGYLMFITYGPVPEMWDVFKRFAKVFEQTYTRFLDLQKAEEQAREAQIEMALEKVRSRTMAMQKSEELPLAANNLFLQVQELGIPAWSAGYCIWQDDKHHANCNMSSEGEIQKGFILPSIGEGYDFYTPQKKGERFHVKELGGEALVKHYEFMTQLPNMGEILKELIDAGLELPTFQIFHIVYFKFGYVMFITYEEVPEAHDIFKRFGQVFEQTYTRFLDLERAEAQAREARIEMALEKVRSRTMAMQKSDELQDAAQVLFNEIRGLGIPSWSCGYNILSDDKKSAECWMSSEGALQKPFTLYYEKEKSFIEQYHFFKSKKNFLVQEQKGRDLVEAYEYMKTIPKIGEIIVDLEESGISLPTHQFNHLCKFNKGYLLFITYEPVTEAHELFVRFTKVFEQTYTRFLDLKQAEARAREAQIQSALERVRSHSMGMQSTTDFANVTTEMFNQLRNFGEDLFATGIVFCDKHEGHVEQWHSIPGAGMLSPMIVPIDLDYIHEYRYDQWKTGTTLFSIEIPSDFIEQHFEAIFKLPSAQITLKDLESRNAPMPAPPDWEIDYGASFKHGYILVSSLKPVENMDILPRFAQVFEQAYIRFLDLQKAEAQARESQIEAALEKVRSRTLAMQKSDELADTSVVVFKELLELGIEPNRLFIGIVKDNGNAIEAWATNEDGSKIEQHFKLYTSKNKSIKKMVDGWKQQKKSAIIDMQGKELQEYFHYLNKVMQIPFIHGLKQKRRVQSIAYFSGGLIGMAAPEEQPEETINLLERFAAVFNLTYTRFNDLKIAEAQAEQAEEDLINLQKAKKNAEEALAELQTTQKQLIQSEKMASLGELTAGIAHEIQNPLNFVNNFSEVSKELLDEMLEEIENGDMEEVKAIMTDVIENLEKINHHGKRADGIVKGMLQHSRASGDKKESTDINALVDEYLRLAYHGLRAKDKSFNAQLVTNFDESVGKVGIIPQDIGRVVLNLLTNAFYAVNEKNKMGIDNYEPTVAVRTKKIKDNIEIEVTDNGNGMPASVKQKIFQPFFTTKPPGQGTGLGLSMSYDIITKGHGGELKVETKEGKGTIFILELPL